MAVTDPLAEAAWGAQEVCQLVEQRARANLPAFLPTDLAEPVTWEQLPSAEAMRSADVPAVAFTTPGLAAPPERVEGGWNATWSVVISVWVRGEDATTASTTSALRRYVKALRCAALAGAPRDWAWVAEEYDPTPVSAVRTLQLGFVQIDVPVFGAVESVKFPSVSTAPLLQRTTVTVTTLDSPED